MDRIRVNGDTYGALCTQLNQMGRGLNNAAGALRKIDISRPAGGSILAALAGIRFSLLDLTLADEAIELLLKRIARSADRAAEASRRLGMRILEAQDAWEQNEQEIIALINGGEAPAGQNSPASDAKKESLEKLFELFDQTPSPEHQSGVQRGRDQMWNPANLIVHESGAIYNIITGNWENVIVNPVEMKAYLFESLLLQYADDDFVPVNMDNLMEVLNTRFDVRMLIVDIIGEVLDVAEVGGVSTIVSIMAGLADDVQQNVFNMINSVLLINTMDKEGAMAAADAYCRSDDPMMRVTGEDVKMLLRADPIMQAQMLTLTTAGDAASDVMETYMYTGIMGAIGMLPGGIAVTAPISATSIVADLAFDASTINQDRHHLIYSSKVATEMYEVFQKDYAIAKANPTDENVSRATASYRAYQHAVSDSYQKSADYSSHADVNDGMKQVMPSLHIVDAVLDGDNAAAYAEHQRSNSEFTMQRADQADKYLQDFLSH